jgi:NAD-dependent dihydropyrimidine dehydrogenase PreA subunit
MAYVIAEPCIGTKDTACVDACPADCIHPKKSTPTCGNFRTQALSDVILEVGADRVFYSVDYPFGPKTASISHHQRLGSGEGRTQVMLKNCSV